MTDLFADLNDEQRFAVETLDGPLCVVAGAGSGKTRVITRRVAHLIARGTDADRILGVTFTNKAAREMRERVFDLAGVSVRSLSTFHSFGASVLRERYDALGRRRDFTIYDQSDATTLLKRVVDELGVDPDLLAPSALQEHFSARRNARPGAEPAWPGRGGLLVDELLAKAYDRYRERLAEANAVDFDDLLVETLRLLEERPEVLADYRDRFTHVLVDEFQDVNYAQYRLVKLLGETSRNLCVTGDPDQSIYSWRGADPRCFDDFRADFPEAQEVVLSQNYRSTNAILRCAGEIMRAAVDRTPKTLWSELGEGEPVRVVRFFDDREEADAIADAVSEWEAEGYPRASQAVMFRVNALSLQVERALVARGIPYRVLGGPEFFGRTEVKDVVAYLRVLANPRDAEALLRIFNVPTRGLGAKTEEAVLAHARAAGRPPLEAVLARDWPPSLPKRATEALNRFAELMERLQAFPVARVGDLVDEVLAATGYLAWWEGKAAKGRALDPQRNLDQLRGLAREFQDDLGGDLAGFLQQTALMGERERRDAFADPVTLLTVHASKGLEFDSVVLIGAEDDLFPHQMTAGEPGGLEEERRLLHVACTRARRRLVLTFCNRRTKFGTSQPSFPSRFLRDLPRDGVEWLGGGATADRPPQPGRDVRFEPDADDPLLHLRRGSAVRHAEYGRGTVVDVRSRARGLDATVCVRFEDGAERRFILGYCKLEALDAGPEDDVVF